MRTYTAEEEGICAVALTEHVSQYQNRDILYTHDTESLLLLVVLTQFGLASTYAIISLVGGIQGFVQSSDPAGYFADSGQVTHLTESVVYLINVSTHICSLEEVTEYKFLDRFLWRTAFWLVRVNHPPRTDTQTAAGVAVVCCLGSESVDMLALRLFFSRSYIACVSSTHRPP